MELKLNVERFTLQVHSRSSKSQKLSISTPEQFHHNILRSHPVHQNNLMPRGLAVRQLDGAARAIELFREESDQRLIGCGIDGRGGHFDLQFIAEDFADFIFRGARLDFDGEADGAFLDSDESGQGHRCLINAAISPQSTNTRKSKSAMNRFRATRRS